MPILFQDDFESGDTSKWNTISGSPTVQSTVKHHGNYALQVSTIGGEDIYVRKNVSVGDTIFARCYVQWDSLDAGANTRCLFLYVDGTPKMILQAFSTGWEIYNGIGWQARIVETVNANQWYCLEFKYVTSTTVGECVFFVDDQKKAEYTGLNTGSSNINNVRIGTSLSAAKANTMYADDAIIADTFIGKNEIGDGKARLLKPSSHGAVY